MKLPIEKKNYLRLFKSQIYFVLDWQNIDLFPFVSYSQYWRLSRMCLFLQSEIIGAKIRLLQQLMHQLLPTEWNSKLDIYIEAYEYFCRSYNLETPLHILSFS